MATRKAFILSHNFQTHNDRALKHLLYSSCVKYSERSEYDLIMKYFKDISLPKCLYKIIYEYFYVPWYCFDHKRIIFQMTKEECDDISYQICHCRNQDYFCFDVCPRFSSAFIRVEYPISHSFVMDCEDVEKVDDYHAESKNVLFKMKDNYYKIGRQYYFKKRIEYCSGVLQNVFKTIYNLDKKRWDRIVDWKYNIRRMGMLAYYNKPINNNSLCFNGIEIF